MEYFVWDCSGNLPAGGDDFSISKLEKLSAQELADKYRSIDLNDSNKREKILLYIRTKDSNFRNSFHDFVLNSKNIPPKR